MYVRAWTSACAWVVLVGAALAWIADPGSTAMSLVSAVLLGTPVVSAWYLLTGRTRIPFWPIVGWVALAGSVAVGVTCLVVLDPWVGAGLVLLAAATTPPQLRVRLLARWRILTVDRHPPTMAPVDGLRGVPDVLRDLTDTELCQAWRRTFVALQAAPPSERPGIVALRAAFLDEMSRRHPRELRAWLAGGWRAGGGPEKYFANPH